MFKFIDRKFSFVPLTLKMLIITILVGVCGFYFITQDDIKALNNLFKVQLDERLEFQAIEDRYNFDSYIKSFNQLVKLTISQKTFHDLINSDEWKRPSSYRIIEYKRLPSWFPKRSIQRSFANVRFAILLDDKGNTRQVYQGFNQSIPKSLLKPSHLLRTLSHNQTYMTNVENKPFLITSESLSDEKGRVIASVMFASPIDDLMLISTQQTFSKEHLVAIFSGENPTVIASNLPDILPGGTTLYSLEKDYHISGKSFFDYGSSDLTLRFVSLIPKKQTDALIQSIIKKKWIDNLIVATLVVASLLVVTYWITNRIKRLTREIIYYTHSKFGSQDKSIKYGDELFILEEKFSNMIDEINQSHDTIKKAKEELEIRVIERTEELGETNRKLVEEIEERKKAVEKNERNYMIQNVISSVLNISLRPNSLKELLQNALDLIMSIPWLSLQSKGAIFLVDEKQQDINMVAQKGLSQPLLKLCASLPLGTCLCGQAVLEKRVIFSNHIDDRHDIQYDNMSPHGHFCVPIILGDKVLGVINLYLAENHVYEKSEEDFLKAMADTLAGIIERKKVSEELAQSHSLLQMLIDSIPDSIYFKDENNRFVKVNKAKAAHSNITPHEMIGKTDFDFLLEHEARVSFEDDEFVKKTAKTIENKVEKLTRKNGEEVWISVVKMPWLGNNGNVIGTMGISRDITKLKQVEEQLRENERQLSFLAYHDPLTGLPNRLLFSDRVKQTLAYSKRKEKLFAVMFLDLDHFKEINDTLGHDKGDELLKEVATRLSQCIRESDTVARQGGDEFVFLIVDINSYDDIKAVNSKIIHILGKVFILGDVEVSITTSLGISVFPDNGSDFDSLVKKADIALYNAKNSGRNKYKFYDESMEEIKTTIKNSP